MTDADPVVRTLDVYLTQSLEEGGLLYLLQSPLRPPNRPYDVEYSEDVRFKVRAVDISGYTSNLRFLFVVEAIATNTNATAWCTLYKRRQRMSHAWLTRPLTFCGCSTLSFPALPDCRSRNKSVSRSSSRSTCPQTRTTRRLHRRCKSAKWRCAQPPCRFAPARSP